MKNQLVINNLLISYSYVPGSRQDSAVLFLHGWRSESVVWQGIVQKMGNEFSYYSLDLPGFGQSQSPPNTFTIAMYAECVAEFIKKMDLKKVVIVGHSFGGRIGIKVSSQHPDLINKLILVDSAGFAQESGKKQITNFAAKIAKPFFGAKFMQPLRKKIYQTLGAEDYIATPQLQKTFMEVIREDLSADMERIQAPTLIVFGENDLDTPPEFGRRMHTLIPNSKLQILTNAGHFSFIDQPEEFIKLVRGFIHI